MYLAAFAVAYLLFKKQVREKKMKISDEEVSNYFFWGIIGLMLGARLFSVFIYSEDRMLYLTHPWLIFWPFSNGRFTGLQGMSYHGGLVGAIAGFVLYCKKHRESVWEWGDMVATAAPLGYTFGRLANFINGELFGRVSTKPWAMVFPHAETFSSQEPWVQNVAHKIGMDISSLSMVNLPRHPSQLYEALFEGVFLWAVLWFIFRKRDLHKGARVSIYLMGYGLVRFFIEYFREPDSQLGYILPWGKGSDDIHLFHSFLNFSMGQILCTLMILGGILLFILQRKFPEKVPEKIVEQKPAEKKPSRRNIRKKIK